MTIPLQLGDIATRVRRFTRAVGNLGVDMQLTATPEILLADISRPPYAAEPKSITFRAVTGSDAVHNPYIACQAAPGTTVVIDQIWAEGLAAAEALLIAIGRNLPAVSLAGTATSVFNVSDPNNNPANNSIMLAQMKAVFASTLTPISNTFQFGQIFAPTPAGTLVQYPMPEPVVLFGGSPSTSLSAVTSGDIFVIAGTANNASIACSVWGREFTLLQGSP